MVEPMQGVPPPPESSGQDDIAPEQDMPPMKIDCRYCANGDATRAGRNTPRAALDPSELTEQRQTELAAVVVNPTASVMCSACERRRVGNILRQHRLAQQGGPPIKRRKSEERAAAGRTSNAVARSASSPTEPGTAHLHSGQYPLLDDACPALPSDATYL